MKKLFTRSNNTDDLRYRSVAVKPAGPKSLDVESRSVEITLATSAPTKVYDWSRGEIVDEILVIAGAKLPKSRSVPMLDVHSKFNTSAVLGSIRELQGEGQELAGRAFFSEAADVQSVWTKVREGHITDFSVGYRPVKSRFIEEGETFQHRGETYKGPVLLTTEWVVKEGSVVPIGADENATARSDNLNSQTKEVHNMDEKLRKYLQKRGLAENATEAEAWAFLEALDVQDQKRAEADKQPKKPENKERKVEGNDDEIQRALAADRERVANLTALGERFDCADRIQQFIKDGTSLERAQFLVADEFIERQIADDNKSGVTHTPPATIIEDAKDKFRDAAEDSLYLRAGVDFGEKKPAAGAEDLRGFSLRELARECLRANGLDYGGAVHQMVGRALTTDDLPYIMANVANKSLAKGWDSAPETWQEWCATASVPDFKTNYQPRMSEFDDLDEIPEHGEYKYGSFTEQQESYSIATYGKLFSISRQAIINDNLGAITTVPARHGEAAARKVGDVAYSVLTANANMGDGNALFSAAHLNFVDDGSGAAPGETTIGAGELAMGKQKDLKGIRVLNIQPVYFIGPRALKTSTEIFFKSITYTTTGTAATDSTFASTRQNIYAGDYFTRIYEARLDVDDAAAWYLAARKGMTVTVFFLDGNMAPYTEQQSGWTVDGTEMKVRIDVGAKALDWVGLYYNDGN